MISRALMTAIYPLYRVSFVEQSGWCSGVVWSRSSGALVLKPLSRGSGAGQRNCARLGPPDGSYTLICGSLPLVLGTEHFIFHWPRRSQQNTYLMERPTANAFLGQPWFQISALPLTLWPWRQLANMSLILYPRLEKRRNLTCKVENEDRKSHQKPKTIQVPDTRGQIEHVTMLKL